MMEFFWNIILLLVGFLLLVKGADFFVDGCSSVAKRLRVPSVIIGLTVVAMGTSLPELAVSCSAAVKGANAIAVSNVIGSNFFNLLVVLGVCSMIRPIGVHESIVRREFPINIAVTVALGLLIMDGIFSGNVSFSEILQDGNLKIGMISRVDGFVLLIVFAAFIYLSVKSAMKARKETQNDEPVYIETPVWKDALCIIGGIVAIALGGDIVVDSAKYIAAVCGMSDTLIGLTICAMGTSLPELVTSIVASRKGENDLAVGNVVGSNLFNILLILGVSSVISPIGVIGFSLIDMLLLFLATILCFVFIQRKGDRELGRGEGLLLFLIYIVYAVYIIIR